MAQMGYDSVFRETATFSVVRCVEIVREYDWGVKGREIGFL